MINSKLFSFLLFSLVLGFSACNNNDDDTTGDCEILVESGVVEIEAAENELPNAILTRTATFIYVNETGDSLFFESEDPTDFSFERVIKTPCLNGDSTTNILQERRKSKRFVSSTRNLGITYSVTKKTNSNFEIDSEGILVITYLNCYVENYSVLVSDLNDFTKNASFSESLNPNECEPFLFTNQTFETIQEVTLNAVLYTGEIKMNKSLIGPNEEIRLFYYDQQVGVLGFEDEDDVVWNLVQ